MLSVLRAALDKPPRLPPLLLWLLLLLATLAGVPGIVLLGYTLAAPLFHAPSMTYAESVGLCLLAGLVVGVVALLKETNT